MKIYKGMLFWMMMFFANVSFGSEFGFLLRDYALPNHESDVSTLGSCAAGGDVWYPKPDFSDIDNPQKNPCHYLLWPTGTVITQNDKEIVVDFSDSLNFTQRDDEKAFDRYVTFKEAGKNPAIWDDYLRVQFDPALENPTLRSLIVSLISNPSSPLPSQLPSGPPIEYLGLITNGVNQVIDVTNAFGPTSNIFSGILFDPSLISTLFVEPTTVDEPGLFALILAGLLPFFVVGSRRGVSRRNFRQVRQG